MAESDNTPDQEGFGEASLGDAQSSNPPPDPEMLRTDGAPGPLQDKASGIPEPRGEEPDPEDPEEELETEEAELPDAVKRARGG